jgi:predicted nucleic acid-binding protein
MAVLVDTSVLARLANTADVAHAIAKRSIVELHRRGETLRVTAQNLVEFRAVATRPIPANGLGLSAAEAEAFSADFLADFPLLPETPDIFPAWQVVVEAHAVVGKQVHDARLVAVCHAHHVTHLLTFNIRHFARIAASPPVLVLVDPATL